LLKKQKKIKNQNKTETPKKPEKTLQKPEKPETYGFPAC
jgi:hypothetical protein